MIATGGNGTIDFVLLKNNVTDWFSPDLSCKYPSRPKLGQFNGDTAYPSFNPWQINLTTRLEPLNCNRSHPISSSAKEKQPGFRIDKCDPRRSLAVRRPGLGTMMDPATFASIE
jgi:hypothetical protein